MTTAVLTTSSTKTTRREPLRAIDMATSQAQTRPASSSAQDTSGKGKGRRTRATANMKEDAIEDGKAVNGVVNGKAAKAAEKKRKAADYDEDVDGFQFTRPDKSKKARPSITGGIAVTEPIMEEPAQQKSPTKRGRPPKSKAGKPINGAAQEGTKVNGATTKGRPGRRSSRNISAEPAKEPEEPSRSTRKLDDIDSLPVEKKRKKGRPSKSKAVDASAFLSPEPSQAGTSKIALPLADTPVIRRNKEMRTEKAQKGQRRSSLGMRGRRASSLIDSGASNALPHKEVSTADFYKHIASDLIEPRRMRQLLTWCATRAMGDKPSGSRSDDESARLAARVIQEELLKDFSNISELSNWFDREDTDPPAVVVKKPNPKNIQNAEKIKELEEHIQRLQNERHALNALLRTPSVPPTKPPLPKQQSEDQRNDQPSEIQTIDVSLLDPSQQALLASLDPSGRQADDNRESEQQPSVPPSDFLPPPTISAVSSRLSRITSSLAPTLDSFAAGIHDIELYRSAGDSVSSQILRICAQRLEERDVRNSLQRLELEGDVDDGGGKERVRIRRERPTEDVGLLLGALSRIEKR